MFGLFRAHKEIHYRGGNYTMDKLRELIKNQRGATAVEYGLILAMIFLAMIVGVSSFGSTTTGMWNYVSTQVLAS